MYATLTYILDRAPVTQSTNSALQNNATLPAPGLLSPPQSQPIATNPTSSNPHLQQSQATDPSALGPDDPHEFQAAVQDMVKDIVKTEQEFEGMAEGLPGLERGQEEQLATMREVDGELKGLGDVEKAAEEDRKKVEERVEGALLGVRRVQ